MNLDRAIFDTIRYYALFDMPVTAVQIWRCLLVNPKTQSNVDHVRYSDIQHVLQQSTFLQDRIENRWGYYFLKDNQESVERRLRRYTLAQHKWLLTKKAVRLLALVPFVRGLFGSGSLALHNTREESDLDLFVIAQKGRIWTARLGLLIMSQLLGRRRTHWDRLAPDKVCLNHYVTDQDMIMPKDVQNIFTAVAYTRLIPVYSHELLGEFQKENMKWKKEFVASPNTPHLHSRYEIVLGKIGKFLKNQVEALLLEPLGDWIEKKAKALQLTAIHKHTQPAQEGRIVATDTELAFHPDTRVPALLAKFGEL